ncbi:caveolin-3-like isoform X2 [Aphidius gifuensis]|nr:caveolin-3-like isoform X2 [Aphidius gifuensis]XP_044010624.1 caveolin-3-like isoform X2 [Aphidius gifuensis]
MKKSSGSSMGPDSAMDLEDRDPNNLNDHLQVNFNEVIGEPDNIRSPECAWRLSRSCFNFSKGCCYISLSIFIAPICALFFGLAFACMSFQHIWCLGPLFKIWKISCNSVRSFFVVFANSLIRPCMESLGYFFYNIRVQNQKIPDNIHFKNEAFIV